MDTISIITPSFNQGCFLDDTISSVLSQSGDFYIDYIIVDGGSTDNSVNVIKKYEQMLKENCKTVLLDGFSYYVKKRSSFNLCNCLGISYRWVSEKDNGQSHAINKGISLMRGDYFAWLNSDDYYIGADVLSRVIDFFNSHPKSGMIYGRGYCVDENKKVFRDFHDNCTTLSFSRSILKYECFILQPAVFIRSEVVRDTGPIDERFYWCMDWDYWIRIARKHTITFFPHWVACWRQYDGIKSLVFCKGTVAEMDTIMKKYSGRLEYIINRWYYQTAMPYYKSINTNHLRYLISLRYKYKIKKILMYGLELAIHYTLVVLAKLFNDARTSSTVSRVAIFTPFEPIDSEIAKYNTRLIQGLLKKKPGLFVDVYVDSDYNPVWLESPGFRILRHEQFHRNNITYDSVWYKVGDDYRDHNYMYPYVRRYGGIVELDDAKLNKTYLHIIETLKSALKQGRLFQCLSTCFEYPELRYYAWYKLVKLMIKRNKELYLDRNLYRKSFLVKKARSIIIRDNHPVHHYRLPQSKCTVIAKGSEINNFTDGPDSSKARRRFKIHKNAYVMVVMGDEGSLPGAGVFLKALTRIRSQVPVLHCILLGDRSPGEGSLQELIKVSRLEKMVRITGRISEEETLEYLSIADSGIDLRVQRSGGLDGPLQEAIENGKVLFMPHFRNAGTFQGESIQTVRGNDNTGKIIADRILWLYNNPGHIYRMGITIETKAPKLNDAVLSGYCEVLGL